SVTSRIRLRHRYGLSRRLRGQLSGSGGRYHPAFTSASRPKSTTNERASPQGRLATPHMWVPRSCQADVESLDCGDRTRRTAARTPPKVDGARTNVQQEESGCHITVTASRKDPTKGDGRLRGRVREHMDGDVLGQRDPRGLLCALAHDHDPGTL